VHPAQLSDGIVSYSKKIFDTGRRPFQPDVASIPRRRQFKVAHELIEEKATQTLDDRE